MTRREGLWFYSHVSFTDQLRSWLQHRNRLEREVRVLLVEQKDGTRKELEDLLYRRRVSCLAVGTIKQAIPHLKKGHFSLIVLPDVVEGLDGVGLIRKMRAENPEMDFLLSTEQPTFALLGAAFELEMPGLIRTPLENPDEVGDLIQRVVRSNVDRRMYDYILAQLRETIGQADERTQEHITEQMKLRLEAYKQQMGPGNRVLVVETEDSTRRLSEYLFLAKNRVEVARSLELALSRINRKGVNLLLLQADEFSGLMPYIMETLRHADSRLEVVFTCREPQEETAALALRLGAAHYAARLEEPPVDLLDRVQGILNRRRLHRLRDNLVVELYLSALAIQPEMEEEEALEMLHRLLDLDQPLELLPPLVPEDNAELEEAVGQLNSVLEHILASETTGPNRWARVENEQQSVEAEDAPGGVERRIHQRLEESQFVRFRPQEEPTFTLAAVGNVSEGGLFIKSERLLPRNTTVEVDLNVEHADQGYNVCCNSRVAWAARRKDDPRKGLGFGVEFLSPPEEVVQLMKEVVESSLKRAP